MRKINLVLKDNDNPADELFEQLVRECRGDVSGKMDCENASIDIDLNALDQDAVQTVMSAAGGNARHWNATRVTLHYGAIKIHCRTKPF